MWRVSSEENKMQWRKTLQWLYKSQSGLQLFKLAESKIKRTTTAYGTAIHRYYQFD
jgi:hypothetical protein